jgi:uncharacterized protein YeaO (DUF488 family)
MKIYTTYFAKVNRLPENIQPISICGRVIDGWSNPQFKKLAPSWSIYKELKYEGGSKERYIERFKEEILANLNASTVLSELLSLREKGKEDIALVCYEKPGDFCHRHLVAEWLMDNLKLEIKEFNYE